MSNFLGVTFPMQKVTPSDDAIVRKAIITDGILSGCELSYAGAGLTMEAGHLIICGRQIRHTVAETWNFGGASTGFARLVFTIDTTKTSTADVFDMVEAAVEYATEADGFYPLEQSDINQSGTKYQVTACIVSLSSGGINDIIQQLPAASAKGAGGLNFKVVGGTTRPADPEENTIWVNTSIPITNVVISNADLLEYDVGTVLIKTDFTSNGYFNVAPGSTVNLYPAKCYQYVDTFGSREIRTAETFRNGKWRDWGKYLFKDGNECAELTGGWAASAAGGSFRAYTTDESIHLEYYNGTTEGTRSYIRTKKAIDVTLMSTLILNSDWIKALDPTYRIRVRVALGSTIPEYNALWYNDFVQSISTLSPSGAPYTMDVRSLSGEYFLYVILEGYNTSGAFARATVDITQIKIE